jgi:hypothetical protein
MTPRSPITVELDTAALARFRKRVERYQGLPLAKRMAKGAEEAARLLVPSVRREAPQGPTGNLKRRVRARTLRARNGGFSGVREYGASVGSTAPHRHLVIRGHEIVGHRPNRVRTGKRTTANPFVDEAAQPRADDALRVIRDAIFRE